MSPKTKPKFTVEQVEALCKEWKTVLVDNNSYGTAWTVPIERVVSWRWIERKMEKKHEYDENK